MAQRRDNDEALANALERTGIVAHVRHGLPNAPRAIAYMPQMLSPPTPEQAQVGRAREGYRQGLVRAARRAPPGTRIDRSV